MPVERLRERQSPSYPILNDQEEINCTEQRVKLLLGQESQGEGTLFLSSRRIIWLSAQDPANGYGIDYPHVVLHALSRDPAAYPEPCIYCQLKGGEEDEGVGPTLPQAEDAAKADSEAAADTDAADVDAEGDDDVDEEDLHDEVPEMRIVPADPRNLQEIFRVFSEMSALNPDPDDEQQDDAFDSDEEEEGGEPNGWSPDADDAAMEDAEEGEPAQSGTVPNGGPAANQPSMAGYR